MATVIDALVVELGLDASKFGSSATQANKSMDGVTKGAKRTAASVDGASNSLIKGAAAFGAFFGAALTISGLNAFVDKVTKMNTELDRTSKNLGTSAQSLKEWQNTAELMGGTAEGVTSTMKGFSKAQTEMSVTGQTGMLPYMRALGVSMFDAQGKARPLGDMLLDLADRFKSMDRTQANNFGQMMGIDQATMNMLLEGRGAVQDMLETQKKMRKPTEDEVKASVELTKARAKLNQQFESLEVVLVGAVTPALIYLTQAAEGFVGFLTENEHEVKAVFLGTSAVIAAVLIPTLWSAAAAALALASPFLLVGAAVALAGVAVGLLLDDYITFTKGGKSVTGGFVAHFKERWRDAGQSFRRILEDFKAYWGDSVEFFKAGWRFIVAIFTGGSDEIRQAGEALAEAFVKPFIRGFELIKDTYNAAKGFIVGKDEPSDPAKPNETAKPVETSKQKTERVTQEAKAVVQNSGAGKAVGDAGVAIGGVVNHSKSKVNKNTLAQMNLVKDDIIFASKAAGVDVRTMFKMAHIESGFRSKVSASTSSASGLYQFINGTWRDMLAKNGAKYGLSQSTPKGDARANALMGAEYLKENAAVIRSMGVKVTDELLYAAHFAGAGGVKQIIRGLKNNPESIAANDMRAQAKANHSVYYNKNGSAKTYQELYNELGRRVNSGSVYADIATGTSASAKATNFVSQSSNAQRLANTTNNNSNSKHIEVAINGMTVNTSANSLQGVAQAGFDASTRRMMIANSDVAMG